ncbi:hypothetical protein JW872_04100 [Candidatus Babeliales bacterium]|nr:hypothetical protein [Candidatus Babeliales bacterium]
MIRSVACNICILLGMTIHAQQRIIFFTRAYPALRDTIDSEKFLQQIQDPGKAARKILKQSIKAYAQPGVFSTYGGYITISNTNGQTSFPRKHQRPFIYVYVTQDINPVIMIGKTVHHWELIPNLPVEVYTIELKQDPDTQLYYWETARTTVPNDDIVPLDSIVIIAKPKNIYVPLGATLTESSSHMLLPDIYIRKGFSPLINSLNVLKTKHFFRQPKIEFKQANSTYWMIQQGD